MTEYYFDFKGTKIFYQTLGDDSAERLLVCVHGLTGNSTDCMPLGQALIPFGYKIASIDMPGRGRSGCFESAQDYNYKIYEDVLWAFLKELKSENYELDWYGISMGGLLGIRIAGQENNPIKKLILNDIGPVVPENDLNLIRAYLKLELRFDTFQEYRDLLKQGREVSYGSLPEELWTQIAENNHWQTKDGQFVPAFDRKIDVMFDREPIGELDLWPYWENINSDILVLRGGKSTLFPLPILEEMKDRQSRDFDVITYEECGHVPPILQKEQIDPVVEWLKS